MAARLFDDAVLDGAELFDFDRPYDTDYGRL
jgi:hypothetical protein